MIKELKKYLNEDEQELLSLIHFHLHYFKELEFRRGGLPQEGIEMMKMLENNEEMLTNVAQSNKEDLQKKFKHSISECPECKIKKERELIGEGKNKQDLICNLYKCDECNKEFLEISPNNLKDQIKFTDNLISLTNAHLMKLAKIPPEIKEYLEQMKKNREIFVKDLQAEEKSNFKLNEATKKLKESAANMRDCLLMSKLKIQNPNASMGES